MDNLSNNLKYALLKKGVDRGEWAPFLSTLLKGSIERAQSVLNGDSPELNQDELKALAHFSGVEQKELLSGDLIEIDKVDVFSKNIAFLIDRLPHGKKKHLAESLGVDQTTISRWGNGTQRPTKKKILTILDYFNLPRTTDLKNDYLFLYTIPIGEDETKKWLKDKINDLNRDRLRELAPALMMLLKGK